jgi:hypothetical protein
MTKTVKIICDDKVIKQYEIMELNFRFPDKGSKINIDGQAYEYNDGHAEHGKNGIDIIINVEKIKAKTA